MQESSRPHELRLSLPTTVFLAWANPCAQGRIAIVMLHSSRGVVSCSPLPMVFQDIGGLHATPSPDDYRRASFVWVNNLRGDNLGETDGAECATKGSGGTRKSCEEQLRAKHDPVPCKMFECRRCFHVSGVWAPHVSRKTSLGFVRAPSSPN